MRKVSPMAPLNDSPTRALMPAMFPAGAQLRGPAEVAPAASACRHSAPPVPSTSAAALKGRKRPGRDPRATPARLGKGAAGPLRGGRREGAGREPAVAMVTGRCCASSCQALRRLRGAQAPLKYTSRASHSPLQNLLSCPKQPSYLLVSLCLPQQHPPVTGGPSLPPVPPRRARRF